MPTTTPTTNPTPAHHSEWAAAESTDSRTVLDEPVEIRTSCSPNAAQMLARCGIAESAARGRIGTAPHCRPRAGPRFL